MQKKSNHVTITSSNTRQSGARRLPSNANSSLVFAGSSVVTAASVMSNPRVWGTRAARSTHSKNGVWVNVLGAGFSEAPLRTMELYSKTSVWGVGQV
jgi:hypothetical protein